MYHCESGVLGRSNLYQEKVALVAQEESDSLTMTIVFLRDVLEWYNCDESYNRTLRKVVKMVRRGAEITVILSKSFVI